MTHTPRPDGPRPGAQVHVLAQAAPQRTIAPADAQELLDMISDLSAAATKAGEAAATPGMTWEQEKQAQSARAYANQVLRDWVADRTQR